MDSLRWLRAIDRSEASADRTFSRLWHITYEEKKEIPDEKRRRGNVVAFLTALPTSEPEGWQPEGGAARKNVVGVAGRPCPEKTPNLT